MMLRSDPLAICFNLLTDKTCLCVLMDVCLILRAHASSPTGLDMTLPLRSPLIHAA